MNNIAIQNAIKYLRDRGTEIPPEILILLGKENIEEDRIAVIKAIKSGAIHSRYIKQADDYMMVRDTFWIAVFDSVFDYLNGDLSLSAAKNKMIMAMSKAYNDTIDIAYVEGGGSLPVDEDTATWGRGELQSQMGYVDSLFTSLKQLKKEEENIDANSEGADRADGYSNALDGFFNGIKLQGAGNKMLTWNLGDAEKHCPTCLGLDGGRHRASWYISKNYIPRKPGSGTSCGGYNCDCMFTDDNGDEFTIALQLPWILQR